MGGQKKDMDQISFSPMQWKKQCIYKMFLISFKTLAFQTHLSFILLSIFLSVALADGDHELGHEPLFRDNAFLR